MEEAAIGEKVGVSLCVRGEREMLELGD